MAVSYFPPLFAALLTGIHLLAWYLGPRKRAAWVLGMCMFVVVLVLSRVFLPGLVYSIGANCGSPYAQYEYARWLENHCSVLQAWLPLPCNSDVESGYLWLERAAQHEYVPAIYMLGVRLKYGIQVPRPDNWTGPGGNTYPQPERGQMLINSALNRGYRPREADASAYYRSFRQ